MFDVANLKFDKSGVIIAVSQDYRTKEVLITGVMNEEAVRKTLQTGKMHYFSRSRNQLWLKGETSGHFQLLKEMRYDCEMNSVLCLIEQVGVACHTGNMSCFYRTAFKMESDEHATITDILTKEYEIVLNRKANPVEGSYTNYLLEKGVDKTLKKVGEEMTEVVIAAKNEDRVELTYEIADLLYHLTVAMVQSGVAWEDVAAEMVKRHKG